MADRVDYYFRQKVTEAELDLTRRQAFVFAPPARAPQATNDARLDWATLLGRTFASDALECPRCFGRLRLVAVVTASGSVATMLDAVCRAPPARARPPPAVQLRLPLG